MKVLFLSRATLYSVFGGDTVQVDATARYLRQLGVEVDIRLCNETIDYGAYDLLHIFNVIRPADTIRHVRASGKPYVLSTIYVDFSEYEKRSRKGLAGLATRLLRRDQQEYLKAILRGVLNGERIQSPEYWWLGHRKAVQQLAKGAAVLLPNSGSEYERFSRDYQIHKDYQIVYYGLDETVFRRPEEVAPREDDLVICVARIEGKKNQLNLIRALNGTGYRLLLIGEPAPNHKRYYEACRAEAGSNVQFEGFVPQDQLYRYYQRAKVHVLASWNETCGLSSLEAGYYGCQIVITDKGDTREYYRDHAWYCDPADPESIRSAIEAAAAAPITNHLRTAVRQQFNWNQAALDTLAAYKTILQ